MTQHTATETDEFGPFDSGPSTIVLGDYVETDNHGHRGRVTQVHHWCPESAAWLAGQTIPVPRDLRDRRWISVLCEPAGAVVVPMSLAKVVDPFPFTNPYADTYFRE